MKKIFSALLLLALTTCSVEPVFAVDNIIVPAGRGQAFLKDNANRLFPASVVYTTDGSGNVQPVASVFGAITIGTVNQGTSGATPWLVSDPTWQADFDAWKTWADVSLSTRASEATLSALNAKVTAVNTGAVVVSSSALPSGAATSALQTTGNTNTGNTAASVASLDSKAPALVSGRVPVDGSGVTQPVSASALPLPSGASTSALQTTSNTNTGNTASSVASIDAKVPALVTGRVPVDPSGVTSPVSVASLPLPSGAATSALQTTGNSSLSSIDGKTPALVTGRVPVDGSGVTQPVSGTVAATQSGVYTARLQDGSGNQVTSQLSGAQRALDVGVNVAGVQVDPRAVRALTSADVVTTVTAGDVASGSADSGNPVKVGAKYNSTEPSFTNGQRGDLQIDDHGAVKVTQVDGYRATYSASFTGLAAANGATDLITITGSASKTVSVIAANVNCTQTTASYDDLLIVKRSTANSAGTSTTATAVSFDSTNAAATATVRGYTANPTLGTAVGTLVSDKRYFSTASGGVSTSVSSAPAFEFGKNSGQAVTLSGTSQVLAINLNGAIGAGGSCNGFITWTEY